MGERIRKNLKNRAKFTSKPTPRIFSINFYAVVTTSNINSYSINDGETNLHVCNYGSEHLYIKMKILDIDNGKIKIKH